MRPRSGLGHLIADCGGGWPLCPGSSRMVTFGVNQSERTLGRPPLGCKRGGAGSGWLMHQYDTSIMMDFAKGGIIVRHSGQELPMSISRATVYGVFRQTVDGRQPGRGRGAASL